MKVGIAPFLQVKFKQRLFVVRSMPKNKKEIQGLENKKQAHMLFSLKLLLAAFAYSIKNIPFIYLEKRVDLPQERLLFSEFLFQAQENLEILQERVFSLCALFPYFVAVKPLAPLVKTEHSSEM